MIFFTGAGNFFKNLWTGLTGPDIQARFTAKPWTKDINLCPAGAVIGYRGNGWLQGAIRKITKFWLNHIGISIGGNKTIEAQGGGINYGIVTPSGKDQAVIFVKTDLTFEQQAQLIGYLEGCVGKKYDYLAIGWNFLVGGDESSDATDFCSELGVRDYMVLNLTISNKKPEESSPGDVGLCLVVKIKGKIECWTLYDTFNITPADAMVVLA